jgi:CBS domain containing-hemolysin-like protein
LNLFALLAIPALILLNALFVAVEYSLVAVRKTRVEEMVKNGVRGAKSVEAAVARLDRSIAATQLGITLASIALGAIGEPAVANLIQPLFEWLPGTWQIITSHSLATIFALLIITMLHVILGEQVPKMAALKATDRTALWLARPLNVWARLSMPVLIFMNAIGNRLLRLLRLRSDGWEKSTHSVDELRLIIEDSQEAGLLETDQALFLQNVFKLTDKTVRDCMVPKEKMDTLEINLPAEKILEIVRDCGHTRLPVFDGNIDNIVGILNTKNLFYFFSIQHAVVLEDAIYPPTFLDPQESIANALRLFRKSRRPMAMVRNAEFRILGLITLEDILEEIVGDIEDEHDAPVPKAKVSKRKKRG